MSEQVNHPQHYGGADNAYEAIKVIEAWELDFCLGNAVKYISRAGKKETDKTVQDLEKAKWYLERKISQLKSADGVNINMSKQTAVDYLVKELSSILGPLETKPMQDLLMVDAINKAKQMEKEQLIAFFDNQ